MTLFKYVILFDQLSCYLPQAILLNELELVYNILKVYICEYHKIRVNMCVFIWLTPFIQQAGITGGPCHL